MVAWRGDEKRDQRGYARVVYHGERFFILVDNSVVNKLRITSYEAWGYIILGGTNEKVCNPQDSILDTREGGTNKKHQNNKRIRGKMEG